MFFCFISLVENWLEKDFQTLDEGQHYLETIYTVYVPLRIHEQINLLILLLLGGGFDRYELTMTRLTHESCVMHNVFQLHVNSST